MLNETLTATLSSAAQPASLGPYLMIVLLVAITVYISHLLRGTILTEGSMALLIGLAFGSTLCIYFEIYKHEKIPPHLVRFKYELYMDILLPPVIFYAGFSIKKKDFFANSTLLVLLGIVGTFLSTAMLALACSWILPLLGLDQHELVGNSLALGAIFSSTDSIAALQVLNHDALPRLYSLVFGEGVVNDATSIVLLRTLQHVRSAAQLNTGSIAFMLLNFVWLCIGSLVLGVGIGLLCAYIIKRSFLGRAECAHEREVSLLALLGLFSYLLAERLGLSGIFASFFCGLSMSHWAWHSLSSEAKVSSLYLFRTMAFLAETMLFLSAGVDMWTTSLWRKDSYTKAKMLNKTVGLAAVLIVLVPVTRAVIVPVVVWVSNRMRPPAARVTKAECGALWWAGSMRGAVTVALAVFHFTSGTDGGAEASIQNQIITESCMAAVVVSTVFLGSATRSVLAFFLENSAEVPEDALLTPAQSLLLVGDTKKRKSFRDLSSGLSAVSITVSGSGGVHLGGGRGGDESIPIPSPFIDNTSPSTNSNSTTVHNALSLLPAAGPPNLPHPTTTTLHTNNDNTVVVVNGNATINNTSSTNNRNRPITHGATTTISTTNTSTTGEGSDTVSNRIRKQWVKFDRQILQPIFGGRTVSVLSLQGLESSLLLEEEVAAGFDEPLGRGASVRL